MLRNRLVCQADRHLNERHTLYFSLRDPKHLYYAVFFQVTICAISSPASGQFQLRWRLCVRRGLLLPHFQEFFPSALTENVDKHWAVQDWEASWNLEIVAFLWSGHLDFVVCSGQHFTHSRFTGVVWDCWCWPRRALALGYVVVMAMLTRYERLLVTLGQSGDGAVSADLVFHRLTFS